MTKNEVQMWLERRPVGVIVDTWVLVLPGQQGAMIFHAVQPEEYCGKREALIVLIRAFAHGAAPEFVAAAIHTNRAAILAAIPLDHMAWPLPVPVPVSGDYPGKKDEKDKKKLVIQELLNQLERMRTYAPIAEHTAS